MNDSATGVCVDSDRGRASRVRARLVGIAATLVCACGALAEPPDLRDEVFYQFMPIAWRDSDNDPHRFGDFGGMSDSLAYLRDLGVTSVWMTPIFPSPAYHGYQHLDADRVDPRFGTEAQFLRFVHSAHERGVRVYLDNVVYGIGQGSTYYQDASKNPASRYTSWLAFKDAANREYQGYTFTTWDGTRVGFIHWNLNSPEPRELVAKWAIHWLDPNGDGDPSDGIDGFRLDHVWAKYKEGPNGWGYNIDSFWIPWKKALRAVNPDVVTFAEQAKWETTGADLLGAFDAAFTKPFEMAARTALRTGQAAPLYSTMASTIAALESAPPNERGGRGTFLAILGDHDVERLATAIDPSFPGRDPSKEVPPTLGFDRARVAAAVLMLQPFTPIIYMGDELAMLGSQRKGKSDANDIPMRMPFKWNAVAGPPMSDYVSAIAPQNGGGGGGVGGAWPSRDHDGRSVEEQTGMPASPLETYRTLIAWRKHADALRRGRYVPLPVAAPSVWAFGRVLEYEKLVVVINLGSDAVEADLDVTPVAGGAGGLSITDPFEATAHPQSLVKQAAALFNSSIRVRLDPMSWVVMKVDPTAAK